MAELYSIYPHEEQDIGDIYSVAYVSTLNTVYIGTQSVAILVSAHMLLARYLLIFVVV